jgi:hypothetical protein
VSYGDTLILMGGFGIFLVLLGLLIVKLQNRKTKAER